MKMLYAEQIRGARAILRMDQAELAELAGVSVETIKRLEKQGGAVGAATGTIEGISAALEAAGVELLDGGGVRMRADRANVYLDLAAAEQLLSELGVELRTLLVQVDSSVALRKRFLETLEKQKGNLVLGKEDLRRIDVVRSILTQADTAIGLIEQAIKVLEKRPRVGKALDRLDEPTRSRAAERS